MRGALGGPRLLRRLREVMAEPVSAQARLDKIVVLIADNMVAEVCSFYVLRADATLELYATEGLNRDAVHLTRMQAGEGLVGLIVKRGRAAEPAERAVAPGLLLPAGDRRRDLPRPSWACRCCAAATRSACWSSRTAPARVYSEDEVEELQTTAMVLAEMIAVRRAGSAGALRASSIAPRRPMTLKGAAFADGVGLGEVVLHEPRVVALELHRRRSRRRRLAPRRRPSTSLRAPIDAHAGAATSADGGEHRDVLETYRMFAHDRGWLRSLRGSGEDRPDRRGRGRARPVRHRARMLRQPDPYLRERLHDLDDLANRLLRHLAGPRHVAGARRCPRTPSWSRATMGPPPCWNTTARACAASCWRRAGRPAMSPSWPGRSAFPAVGGVDNADRMARTGRRHHRRRRRPGEVLPAAAARRRRPPIARSRSACARARQEQYRQAARPPGVTRDGAKITLLMNAGLLIDLRILPRPAREGIGLFRTEFQFMVAEEMPRISEQTALYSRGDGGGGRPAGDLPHPRHRRRQGAALHAAERRGEPGAGLARDPHRPRPARPAARAAARPAAARRPGAHSRSCCR